jgi:cytochrome c2
MKMHTWLMAASVGFVTLMPTLAQAEADWKRGRVYYRMVCTQCHAEKAGGAISPSVKTKAEWVAYFQADKHAKGKDSVKYYFSSKFRDSIKATNKAAAKFAEVPEADLAADVKEFLQKGAKGGDAPARCS